MLGLKLNHVSKRGYWRQWPYHEANTNVMHIANDADLKTNMFSGEKQHHPFGMLKQDCGNSIANELELPQSHTKLLKYVMYNPLMKCCQRISNIVVADIILSKARHLIGENEVFVVSFGNFFIFCLKWIVNVIQNLGRFSLQYLASNITVTWYSNR